MEKKLKPLGDFIEDIQREICPTSLTVEQDKAASDWRRVVERKDFGKQKLKLGMFIPTDKEGNVLEKPNHEGYPHPLEQKARDNEAKQYQEALDRVIFVNEGKYKWAKQSDLHFDVDLMLSENAGTIEDLVHLNLTLKQG